MPTLAELKAENAAAEAAEQEAIKKAQEAEQEEEQEEPEVEAKDDAETSAEDDKEGSDDKESADDAWMQAEESEPEQEAKFTDSDAAAIRRKYKAKVAEKDEQLSKLQAEIEALKQTKTQVQQQSLPGKPVRDNFNSDEEFIEALTDYKISLVEEKTQSQLTATEKQRQQAERERQVAAEVDNHYLRAAKLSEKSGIKPEAYQSADLMVRTSIEKVFPKAGDAITDALIASLGDGSEKVFYHLGVNPAKRAQLVKLFEEDRSGIKAAAFLGTLKAALNSPARRETQAPDPIEKIQGDKAGNNNGDKLYRQYKDAHKRGDGQAAFNAKRQAKAAGIDVSKWS